MTNKEKLDLLYQGMPDKPDATEGPVAHFFGAGIYCRRMFVPKDEVVRMHVHSYDHLTIIGSGHGRLMRDNGIMEVSAGDVIEVKAGQQHAFLATGDTVWLCVHSSSQKEARELYGWRARITRRIRSLFDRLTSAHFLGTAAAVVGIASSAKSLFDDSGEKKAQAGENQANWDFEEAGKERALSGAQRGTASDLWGKSLVTGERGQTYYDALADHGAEQLNVWRQNGLPILQELNSRMADATDRTGEETGLAADQVKNQYAIGRQNTQRALEFARNPGDPGYADILRESYGREAADVAGAITNARRAERERLAGVERENTGRKMALANIYGQYGVQGANTLATAGAGTRGTAALQGTAASAASADANAAAQRAITLSGASYNARDRGLTQADQNAAQLGYGGTMLAKNAERWFGGINPKTGQAIETPPQTFDANSADWNQEYAEGGKIDGPGTGTSDSVQAIKKPGTYILSADTVRAIGTKKLTDLMDKAGVRPGFGGGNDHAGVPVKLSNGEWSMPPEVTTHYGEEFFNKLQQKHHRPVFSEDAAMATGCDPPAGTSTVG